MEIIKFCEVTMGAQSTYTLLNVGKIIAGPDSIKMIHSIPAEYGAKKVLIITDQGVWKAGLIDKPKRILESSGIQVDIINTVPPEPEKEQVEIIVDAARNIQCGMIIGIGGGSAMDVAKIVSVMLTNTVSLRQLLDKAPIEHRGLPMLMIPTTAGTGSEATPNAIILVPEEGLKIGIVNSKLVPDSVILDPLLTIGLPPAITASTGMDALTHAIECYISKKANPFSDTFALMAINFITRSIRQAYRNGADVEARHDMLLGALYGGMCIATSSTTAVHALAYPLGGTFRIPHGLSNAILLPSVMQFNIDAAEDKFRDIAIAIGCITSKQFPKRQAAERMIESLYALIADLNIQTSLRVYGITEADLDGMAEAAFKVTRLLDNNPKTMSKSDIRNIYRKLL